MKKKTNYSYQITKRGKKFAFIYLHINLKALLMSQLVFCQSIFIQSNFVLGRVL
uniref:Uncharacterized protein n=1 Tax=Lepeophtheirus salmonis TaxID=72036 RepID=A0A0K2T0X9_LEPSM